MIAISVLRTYVGQFISCLQVHPHMRDAHDHIPFYIQDPTFIFFKTKMPNPAVLNVREEARPSAPVGPPLSNILSQGYHGGMFGARLDREIFFSRITGVSSPDEIPTCKNLKKFPWSSLGVREWRAICWVVLVTEAEFSIKCGGGSVDTDRKLPPMNNWAETAASPSLPHNIEGEQT